jgi:HEAT repeat protein
MILVPLAIASWLGGGHALPQDPTPAQGLVQEFRAAKLFDRQLEIAWKIVALRQAETLAELEPWLTHEDRHIRGNVAFIFASLGDPAGLRTIGGILADRSPRTGGQGIPGARWSLEKQIESDRYYAVHLLGELKNLDTVPLLLPLLADEQVNYKVAWALGQIGDGRAVKPLIEALNHRTALMRVSAIQALTMMRTRGAIPHIRALINDEALPSAGDRVSVGATARAAILELERLPRPPGSAEDPDERSVPPRS